MNSERLAYWYFRLNGFLTTENFIVHPDSGSEQRTDADLLAVRFADRAENLDEPMEDDARISRANTYANIVIAEVKTSDCKLNGPWTLPDDRNMNRVIKAIGCMPDASVEAASQSLYSTGAWSGGNATIRLIAIGDRKNPKLELHGGATLPLEQQISWSEIVAFVIMRFKTYKRQKSSVPQWTYDGKKLQRLCLGREPEREIRKAFLLPEYNEGREFP